MTAQRAILVRDGESWGVVFLNGAAVTAATFAGGPIVLPLPYRRDVPLATVEAAVMADNPGLILERAGSLV